MIKLIASSRRRPGITRQEMWRHMRVVNGGIVVANPTKVKAYVHNYVLDSAYGAEGDDASPDMFQRDTIVELYFDSPDTMGDTFADPYVQEVVGPDGPMFGDLSVGSSFVCREEPVEVPRPGTGGFKILHYIRKPDGIDYQEFDRRWAEAIRHILRSGRYPEISWELRRYVRNLPMPEARSKSGFFAEGWDSPAFGGAGSMWFDSEAALYAFKIFRNALEDYSRENGEFVLPSLSFYACVKEVVVHDDRTPDGEIS